MISKSTITFGLIAALVLASFGSLYLMGGDGEAVVQRGSDTMLELMQECAEQFNSDYPNLTVEVTGGGSGTGIAALSNGQIDVAQASREIRDVEVKNAQNNGVSPLEFRVAIDGIAVVVNNDNPISNLTARELRGIYNGTYTNWNQMGGPSEEIVTYGRQSTSGTYAFFQETILHKEDYTSNMNQLAGNAAIIDAVGLDKGGIGYVGLGYAENAENVKVLPIANEEGGHAYSPFDSDAVYSGDYVLARYLYLYTDGVPTGAVKTWISWVLDEGQRVAEEVGFYALSQEIINEELAKLE